MTLAWDESSERIATGQFNLEPLLHSFEQAWQQGERPDLADFLPADPALRRVVLIDLVHIDLQRRLTLGEPARVESYLQRYPELESDPALVKELIAAEFELRQRQERDLSAAEYLQRFPQHGDWLAVYLKPTVAAGTETGVGDTDTAPPNSPDATDDVPATLAGTYRPAGIPSMPTIAGYEVLQLLGRGGMGVVYKALHIALKRLVAIKMIRAGDAADRDTLTRFRIEAEAVARLQHPNIVQIYEVSEANGQPYFSLEYVPGGSLADWLKGGPLSALQAAQIVQALAKGIHAAHQHEVIHRDLKPANVLLTEDGTPKITDFGLAKQLDDGAVQTRSGTAMGTPCYMPPEQAAGHAHAMGPLCDVYALGAVLYECLTGQPPFRADNALATLDLVLKQDPVRPTLLRRNIPRDLETICLKCLEKDPQRRYASAADLADDLQRFLNHEPILARPVGHAERAWRWVKRRPAWAAVAGMTVLVTLLSLAVLWIWPQVQQAQAIAREKAQLAQLTSAFEAGLEHREWTPAHMEQMEAQLAELARLAPEQAESSGKRLQQRYADAIRDSFSPLHKPILAPADVPAIEATIRHLEARAPELASAVRADLDKRRHSRQVVIDLKQPIASEPAARLASLLPARQFKVIQDALVPVADKQKYDPLVRTSVTAAADMELEAVFHPDSWLAASRIGLALHADEKNQYVFQLTLPRLIAAAQPEEGPPPPPIRSFAEAQQTQDLVALQILRNGLLMQERLVSGADVRKSTAVSGGLRLWAKRQGSHLLFQVNNAHLLDFREIFPPSKRSKMVFALVWPAEAGLQSLRAWNQHLPAVPSPLEQGDQLYADGQYADALTAYRAQANAAVAADVQREARHKEGLCEFALGHHKEATDIFTALLADPAAKHWELPTLCYLWRLAIEKERWDDAEKVFLRINAQFRFEELMAQVPSHIRYEILSRYYNSAKLTPFEALYRTNRVRNIERAVAVEDFLAAGQPRNGVPIRFYLFRAYAFDGQLDKALQTAATIFRIAPACTPQNRMWWLAFCEEYSMLLRLTDDGRGRPPDDGRGRPQGPQQALTELDRRLFEKPGKHRKICLPLLVERARIHVALEQWEEAEKDLDDFFKHFPAGSVSSRYWAQACLALGFVRAQRGDEPGAREAWRRGLPKHQPAYPWGGPEHHYLVFAIQMMLASLADDLPDSEVAILMDRGFEMSRGLRSLDAPAAKTAFNALLPEFTPAMLGPLLREMWRTPEGRKLARENAFQQRSAPDLLRASSIYSCVKLGHHMLEPSRLTADEDALMRQFVADGYQSVTQGKLGKQQGLAVLQMGLFWKGQGGLLVWDFAARSFEPNLRGPMAYFMGVRYRDHFRKTDEALSFFQTALKGAPAKSLLYRLAQAELSRLKKSVSRTASP